MRIWPLFLLFALAVEAPAAEPRSLHTFDTDTELQSARTNHVALAIEDGRLAVTFQPPAMYPGVWWGAAQPWDWSGFGGLALDVTNSGPDAVTFCIRIDDDPAAGDGKTHSRSRAGRVQSGQGVTYLIPFDADPLAADMSGLPGLTVMRDTGPGSSTPFDPHHIVSWNLFTVKPANPVTLAFDNVRLIPELPPRPYQAETNMLRSFGDAGDLRGITTNTASVALTADGRLAMTYGVTAWPAVYFNLEQPADWRGYGGLALDLRNTDSQPVRFGVRIDDDPAADGHVHCRTGGAVLEPGEAISYVLPFGADPMSLGMKSLPGFNAMRSLGSGGAGPFNLGHIIAYQVFLVKPSAPHTLAVDNIRLVPGAPQDFAKLVDAFGQYTRADWPGKLKSADELGARRDAEAGALKAAPALPDRNAYGGWANGPRLAATGFFRTEKVGGKWSLVDPDGRLFFSVGLDTVGPAAYSMVSGREHMYSIPPASDPVLAKHVRREKGVLYGPVKEGDAVDFYGANLERKYGPDYMAAWLATTLARLPAWGINTIGAFASYRVNTNGVVPYTFTLWPASNHARVATGNDLWRTMDDPFDPKFAADVAAAVRWVPAAVKADPYCIGYFVGNEESWGYGVARGTLKGQLESSPAKQALLAQLRETYADVSALNQAWGTAFADWDALAAPCVVQDPLRAAVQADLAAFLKRFALRYFQVVRDELKKADPNHLYLGCRFAGYTPEVLEAAAAGTDVMSFNIYRLGVPAREWAVLDGLDHPVVIGEFHFGATDRGLFDAGLLPVADQAARGKAYRDYVRSVLDHPLFVGCHWFQYVDEPLLGRTLDGENANIGFVDVTDTPYPELIEAARQVHAEMYTRRFGN